jgi:hypothetical protein
MRMSEMVDNVVTIITAKELEATAAHGAPAPGSAATAAHGAPAPGSAATAAHGAPVLQAHDGPVPPDSSSEYQDVNSDSESSGEPGAVLEFYLHHNRHTELAGMDPTDKVSDLEDFASNVLHIVPGSFYLSYGGVPMQADMELEFYNIKHESTVDVKVRMHAGMKRGRTGSRGVRTPVTAAHGAPRQPPDAPFNKTIALNDIAEEFDTMVTAIRAKKRLFSDPFVEATIDKSTGIVNAVKETPEITMQAHIGKLNVDKLQSINSVCGTKNYDQIYNYLAWAIFEDELKAIDEKTKGYKLLEDLSKHVTYHMYTGFVMDFQGSNSHVKFSTFIADALVEAGRGKGQAEGRQQGRQDVINEVRVAQAQGQIIMQPGVPGVPQQPGGQPPDVQMQG